MSELNAMYATDEWNNADTTRRDELDTTQSLFDIESNPDYKAAYDAGDDARKSELLQTVTDYRRSLTPEYFQDDPKAEVEVEEPESEFEEENSESLSRALVSSFSYKIRK